MVELAQLAPGESPIDPWPKPYFLADGLRRVTPYHHKYRTYCKERWRNRALLDIFVDEFRDRPEEYYKEAIQSGKIQVNHETVTDVSRIIKNGEIITHDVHRHEPPVSSQSIAVVHEDYQMMVINKPAGVPVHPAGRYFHNSVIEIIRASRGFAPLPCHRLDRLTSGILFIAKTPAAAERMQYQITAREVEKEYVARVKGKFPPNATCEKPVLVISPKLGLNRVRANGKYAKTIFKRLAYSPEGDYSVVQCLPLTGRTHQLRVHLQFLGHPITNDPIYSNRGVFGANLGKGAFEGDDDESIIERLSKMGKEEVAEAVSYHDEMVEDYNKRKAEQRTGKQCTECGTDLYSDPGQHELGIYLHALRYAHADGSWSYRTALPAWAHLVDPKQLEEPGKSVEAHPQAELVVDDIKLGDLRIAEA